MSIWQLIVALQKYGQLLIEEPNKINFSPDATPKVIIALITTGKGTITFDCEDLLPGATTHNSALYSPMTFLQKHVPLSLVDNRLAMHVWPWRTITKLGLRKVSSQSS